jgi:hypothetical protein
MPIQKTIIDKEFEGAEERFPLGPYFVYVKAS